MSGSTTRRFFVPRITPLVLALFLACALVAPAAASSRTPSSPQIIAQKSAKKGAQTVYLAHALLSGHTYRIEIVSSSRASVAAQGFMNYAYVSNHQLRQGMKPLSLRGASPLSHTVKPPVSNRLSQWTLVVDASVTGKHPLTVRYRDLGIKK
jgi:hypothetical protein